MGVPEHVHGIRTRQVTGRVGNRLGWYGLGVGRCQLLIPADLVESWWGRAGRGGWWLVAWLPAPRCPHLAGNFLWVPLASPLHLPSVGGSVGVGGRSAEVSPPLFSMYLNTIK